MRLRLFGPVDEKMLRKTAKFVGNYLDNSEFTKVIVEICSPGGDPDIALAILGYLKQLPRIETRVYGQCFSAATMLFAAGETRKVHQWAMVMVHESSDRVAGNASTIKYHARSMEKMELHWNTALHTLTGTEVKVWEKLNERDTYLNADECLKLNLATEIFT